MDTSICRNLKRTREDTGDSNQDNKKIQNFRLNNSLSHKWLTILLQKKRQNNTNLHINQEQKYCYYCDELETTICKLCNNPICSICGLNSDLCLNCRY